MKKINNKNKIKTLTIDRAKWGFGTGGGRLLDKSNDKMCCLGFFSRKCGYKAKDIRDKGMPDEILENYKGYKFENSPRFQKLNCLLAGADGEFMNNALADDLANINDDCHYNDLKTRENDIIKKFKKIGVNVRFVGKVPEEE